MHLASRWFTRLDFDQEIPDPSTLSKNRHGRFRQSGVFREVFEEIVRRCLAAGLVEGRHLTVDGTLVEADASPHSRVPREQLADVARLSRTAQEYLAEVEQQNPVADPAEPPPAASGTVSTTDPDAAWAVKWGRAALAYYDNYLIDPTSRVILAVEATPARFRRETRGRPADVRAPRPAGAAPGEPRRGQGLRQRRVFGVALGPGHRPPHPRH